MGLEALSRVIRPAPSSRAASRRASVAWLLFVAGGACAILTAELGLIPLTTPLDNVWAPISADRLDSPVREVRRFTETIAASHFSLSRARLTGNPPLAGAPVGVILGDSHVEALEVADRETMGAVLERMLRKSGRRINVRQYGWYGADVPKYAVEAPGIIQAWDPAWVVVVVTASDFGPTLLSGREKLIRQPDGSWQAKGAAEARPRPGSVRAMAETALHRSGLLYHLAKRAQFAGLPLIRAGNPVREGVASLRPGAMPLSQRALISLGVLRDVYGNRLRILFAANVGLDGQAAVSPAERAVTEACATLRLRCANTRALMEQDRRDSLRLSRGFMNSEPGSGHLNVVGHTLAARTMLWNLLTP